MKSYQNGLMRMCPLCECIYHRPEISFYKDKSRDDKLTSLCKFCAKDFTKKYYYKNKEKKLSYQKSYYLENKERLDEYRKEYDNKDRERFREYKRNYYHLHKERIKEWMNQERVKIKRREYTRKQTAKRKRELGYFPLFNNPFPNEVDIDMHHINNLIVIPIPRNLHRNNLGLKHRENVNKIIEELYLLDLDRMLHL